MIGKLFIISACSGAGKSTLVREALRILQPHYNVKQVTTYTSKKPRAGEIDGKDYFFISRKEFDERAKKGFFLEWSAAYGNSYGSPRAVLDWIKEGCSYIMILDRAGALKVYEQYKDTMLIWVDTPSFSQLKKQLSQRKTESKEQINFRLERAEIELALELKEPVYHHHVLNDSVFKAARQLCDIFEKTLAHE